MQHYIAIMVEDDVGEWRVVFPDVPGCEAKGFSLDDAEVVAATALRRYIREGSAPPLPMDLTAVEQNEDWLRRNHIDLAKAVVTMIQVAP
jgi:predicted RNase H-like HicB family nuclease